MTLLSGTVAGVPPGAVIGIIGGGQLGRMSAMAAARLGYLTHIYHTAPGGPASQVSTYSTVADFSDQTALRRFAESVEIITFEFENLPAPSLELLESLRPVHPSANILRISQDRILEKTFLNQIGVPTAPWAPVTSQATLATAIATIGLPAILKTTRLGYDGKGQTLIQSPAEAATAFATLAPHPLILEGLVNFATEISVITARNATGTTVAFDPVENRHKNHILNLTLAPAPLPTQLLTEATRLARHITENLNLTGLLATEMFVTATGTLIVNELAPRPHNSGHWSIDACPHSQFDLHIRAITNLPLPPATRHSDAVMKNLIGPEDMTLWPAILATPTLIPHHYGKTEARPGRKMAHITRLFPKGALPGEFGIQNALQPTS